MTDSSPEEYQPDNYYMTERDAEALAEEAAEALYFDRLERRDEIMGFHDHMDPPDPDVYYEED